jgi:hypothetical protein
VEGARDQPSKPRLLNPLATYPLVDVRTLGLAKMEISQRGAARRGRVNDSEPGRSRRDLPNGQRE